METSGSPTIPLPPAAALVLALALALILMPDLTRVVVGVLMRASIATGSLEVPRTLNRCTSYHFNRQKSRNLGLQLPLLPMRIIIAAIRSYLKRSRSQ
jgi:hypothetical protein